MMSIVQCWRGWSSRRKSVKGQFYRLRPRPPLFCSAGALTGSPSPPFVVARLVQELQEQQMRKKALMSLNDRRVNSINMVPTAVNDVLKVRATILP